LTVLNKEDFVKKIDAAKIEEYNKHITLNERGEYAFSWSFHYCLKRERKMIPPKALKDFYGNVIKEIENAIKMPTENDGCIDFINHTIEEKYKNRLAEAYKQFGDKMLRQGNFNQASEYYNKAIANCYTYDSSMYDACIEACELSNDFKSAMIIKDKKENIEKENVENQANELYYRGGMKYNEKDYAGAIEDYNKAIELGFTDQNIYDDVINAYQALCGNSRGAKKMQQLKNMLDCPF
jgi:tetratricopeptide (TPR) repeat protein